MWLRFLSILTTALLVAGLAIVFAINSMERAAWIAGLVSALAGVVAAAAGVYAVLPRTGSATRSARRTGNASAKGAGSRAVSGVAGAGSAQDTGAARAADGGTAVSGVDGGA